MLVPPPEREALPLVRLGILADYPEEVWPSMDLCAQMLYQTLQAQPEVGLQVQHICPVFKRRFSRWPWLGRQSSMVNGDRLLNRFWDYPAYMKQRVGEFDLFHISDHSYAQLVHGLPPERTGVFCHDLDTFASLLQPQQVPRSAWFRAMTGRILTGLQKAAVVFYTTSTIRSQIEAYGLVEASRLVQAPLGIAPEYKPERPVQPGPEVQKLEPAIAQGPFVLHVGSCIPRKRIDLLLEVVARLRVHEPTLRLVKVGGDWSAAQRSQITKLGLETALCHFKGLERSTIAELYRRAAVVMLTSEAEGFGLPVIEALACGAIAIVSDLPVLREVGGAAAIYCSLTDIEGWVETIRQVLSCPELAPSLEVRLAQAQKYSWSAHAQVIAQAYLERCWGQAR